MKAVMDQSIYSLRGFHQIRHHSLAPPIERWKPSEMITLPDTNGFACKER